LKSDQTKRIPEAEESGMAASKVTRTHARTSLLSARACLPDWSFSALAHHDICVLCCRRRSCLFFPLPERACRA